MNNLDIGLYCFVLIGIGIGLWRGLVHEIFTLIALPLSFFAAYYSHTPVLDNFFAGNASDVTHIVLYVLTFLLCYIGLYSISVLIISMFKFVHLTAMDKLLGALFGGLKHALIVLVVVMGVLAYPIPKIMKPLRDSQAVQQLVEMTWYVHQSCPEPYKSGVQKYIKSLKRLRVGAEKPQSSQEK